MICSERDIIRPRLARFHREMAAGVAGHADLRLGAEQFARGARIAVVLAEMDAVGTESLGQAHAVVDDERHPGVGAHALDRLGQPGDVVIVQPLETELEGGDRPRLERGGEAAGEPRVDRGWRDQVEPARRALLRLEARGETGVERERVFIFVTALPARVHEAVFSAEAV